MKRFLIMIFIMTLAFATMSPEETNAAKQLINANISCDKLNSSQLVLIGDYYMEQMHPGQAHEYMDQMMGGEGSASLNATHIQIAEALYCGQTNISITYGGMMGMMPMMYRYGGGGGMMGFGGMMGGYPYNGMMGGYSGFDWILSLAFWILVFAALVLLIFWLYKSISGKVTASGVELLKQRYAKGEISKKEYQEMKKDLESG